MRRGAAAVPAAAVGAVLAVAVTGCGGDSGGPELRAEGGFLPQPVLADPEGGMAAGYVTVRNDGDADDRLTSVSTDLAEQVTMHTTEGERMRKVDGLDVPAGGALTLARGGAHLMLEKLAHKPEVGEKVTFTLNFADSDPVEVEVPVQPTTYRPED